MLRGLLRWGQEGLEEGVWAMRRVGLSLRGNGLKPPTPHSLYAIEDGVSVGTVSKNLKVG